MNAPQTLTLIMLLMPATASAKVLPRVLAVAPSGSEVPERLLRISLTFATPPTVPVLGQIALRREDGSRIAAPFVKQELWSPDGRTLTLLLDPGRVKTGLIAHDRAGWILPAGKRISLLVGGRVVQQWRVRRGGCIAPVLTNWRITTPAAGSRQPLTLTFAGPIDAQSAGLIALADSAGERVAGRIELSAGERVWRLMPTVTWHRGRYQLVVHPRLEDPCGDELGETFEHRPGAGLGSRRTASIREFTIH